MTVSCTHLRPNREQYASTKYRVTFATWQPLNNFIFYTHVFCLNPDLAGRRQAPLRQRKIISCNRACNPWRPGSLLAAWHRYTQAVPSLSAVKKYKIPDGRTRRARWREHYNWLWQRGNMKGCQLTLSSRTIQQSWSLSVYSMERAIFFIAIIKKVNRYSKHTKKQYEWTVQRVLWKTPRGDRDTKQCIGLSG